MTMPVAASPESKINSVYLGTKTLSPRNVKFGREIPGEVTCHSVNKDFPMDKQNI